MRISCLHAHHDSIANFEAAAPPDIALVHHVRTLPSHRQGVAGAALAVETSLILARAARGSDAVLVTCPVLSAVTAPPALRYPQMLTRAIEALSGTVEVLATRGPVQPRLARAIAESNARLVDLSGCSDADLEAHVGDSKADHLILLDPRSSGPHSDGRVRPAAELVLEAVVATGPGTTSQ